MREGKGEGMNKKMILKFCVALAVTGAASLNAQMTTVKEYHEWKDVLETAKNDPGYAQAKSAFDLYFKGIGDGFVWANAELLSTKRERLFCAPQELGLNSENYHQILESFLPTLSKRIHGATVSWKSVEDVPFGYALMTALINAFPCGAPAKP
jgi:hypothetical protein